MDPIRCFSCGKVLRFFGESISTIRSLDLEERKRVFLKLQVTRLCCKRMYLSAIDFSEQLFQYEDARKTLNFDGSLQKINFLQIN